jgi:putative DNA-invertase from lambdoid prophage Rac
MSKTTIYLRVSTDRQDIDTQLNSCLSYCSSNGLDNITIVRDEAISGTVPWKKRKLETVVSNSKRGDAIVLPELSRAGRDQHDVDSFLTECYNKKILIYAVKGDLKLLWDNNPTSGIMKACYNAMAYMERELISKRTKEGLARRRREVEAEGKDWKEYCKGDPATRKVQRKRQSSILEPERQKMVELFTKKKTSVKDIARTTGRGYETVRSILIEANVWTPRWDRDQTMTGKLREHDGEIAKLIQDGWRNTQIAKLFDVSYGTVGNYVKDRRKEDPRFIRRRGTV